MEVSIQSGGKEHLKGIHGLVLDWGYSVSEPATLEWLHTLLNSPNHDIFVAVSNDSVSGWAVVEKRILLGEGYICEITGLVVSSESRRLGIGKLLVNAVETWSKNLGLSRVVVRSNLNRLESHEFYPSVGFELTKTTHVYAKELKTPNKSRKADA